MKDYVYRKKQLLLRNTALIVTSLLPLLTYGSNQKKLVQHNNRFEIKLNKSKIIYLEQFGSQGTSINVSNKGKKPLLLKSGTLQQDRTKKGAYLIAPPLFLLSPDDHASLTINMIHNNFPSNQESMNWACFTALPPKNIGEKSNDKKNVNLDVNLSINTCIKILYRPDSVPNPMKIDSKSLSWRYSNGELTAINNTPYFISLSDIFSSGKSFHSVIGYVSPHGSITIKSPIYMQGQSIHWKSYDDFGSEIGPFSNKVN